MRISKLKKYVTWNIISVIGYCSLIIVACFLVMFLLSSSQIGMRRDLDNIFFDYTLKYVLVPYFSFYKLQLSAVAFFALGSILEKRYYYEQTHFGLRIFENHDKFYSILFVIGLSLNFLPLYIITLYIIKIFVRLL